MVALYDSGAQIPKTIDAATVRIPQVHFMAKLMARSLEIARDGTDGGTFSWTDDVMGWVFVLVGAVGGGEVAMRGSLSWTVGP